MTEAVREIRSAEPRSSSKGMKSESPTSVPLTAQLTLVLPLRSPARVTVKVKGVAPRSSSGLSALVAAIDSDASSLRMMWR